MIQYKYIVKTTFQRFTEYKDIKSKDNAVHGSACFSFFVFVLFFLFEFCPFSNNFLLTTMLTPPCLVPPPPPPRPPPGKGAGNVRCPPTGRQAWDEPRLP